MTEAAEISKDTENYEFNMVVLSNAPTELHYGILEMFYKGVLANSVGLMEAKHKDTGVVELLLVGVDKEGEEYKAYPLARIFKKEDDGVYMVPDGKGGYG